MGKKLIIAEKPSLAMHIVKAIGSTQKHDGYFENDQYIITFAFGHLFGLKTIEDYLEKDLKSRWCMEDLPYIPNKFEYKINDDPGVKKQYKTIKSLFQRQDVDGVINAGDPDREGSVIILNIIHQLEQETKLVKQIKRAWFTATTPEFIRENLKALKEESDYGNLYQEGLARTYIDWLYGINYSRYLTLRAGTSFPVGRVLVPIVKFVYDRDKEIEEFKKSIFYEIDVVINKDGQAVKGKIKGLKFGESERELGKRKVQDLRQYKPYVDMVEDKEVKKQPPKLFSLDTLQNKLSKEKKYSSSETLKYVQSLYEKGLVTYPRTNTEYLSTAEKGMITKLIDQYQTTEWPLIMKEKATIFDDSKIEGHTALIITNKLPELTELSEQERVVYQTIKNRFLSNFLLEDCLVNQTKVVIKVGEEEIQLAGNAIKQQGFFVLEPGKNEVFLPNFKEGEKLDIDLELVEKETKPPGRVTESELNEFLKNPFKKKEIEEQKNDDEEYKAILSGAEIGTVATRAGIIDNAIKYEYLEKRKNTFHIGQNGVQLVEILVKTGINIHKNKTVEVGMNLKLIFKKQKSIAEVVENVEKEIKEVISNGSSIQIEKIERVERESVPCPICKKGKVITGKDNYFCSNYKDGCKFSIGKEIASKKLTVLHVEQLISKGYTNKIKGFKSKAGKPFEAKLKLNNIGKIEFDFS